MTASNDSYSLTDAKELEGVLPIMNKIIKNNGILEKYRNLVKKLLVKLKKLLSLDNINSPKKEGNISEKQGDDNVNQNDNENNNED